MDFSSWKEKLSTSYFSIFYMKRILREIIEIIRMKMGEILIFESLFYNSLILNFVFHVNLNKKKYHTR